MSQTIKKSLGEGHGKGELYAALAHDTSDNFGGMEIKSICLNFSTYDETDGDGRVCFGNRDMYIAPYLTDGIDGENELDIVADEGIWLISDDIYLLGNLHFWGDHSVETGTSTIAVTLTDPTSAANALYGYVDAGATWTSGNMVGLRGFVNISYGGTTHSATGVWAGLNITSASVQRFGLQVALNAEAYSSTVCVPNAIMYLQSLPYGANSDFSDVPYLVFSETVTSGTGSNILFEVGHSWANTVPTKNTEDFLFYQDTLRIAVNKTAGNRTKYYIPLSVTTGTFTYAYNIISTATGVGAIQMADGGYIQFLDNGMYMGSTVAGTLDIVSDGTLAIASPGVTFVSTIAASATYGVLIDYDAPFLTITNIHSAMLDLDVTTTSAVSGGAWDTSGRLYGERITVNLAHKVTNTYGLKAKVLTTGTTQLNDVVGVFGELEIDGTHTKGQTASSMAALRGDISNLSGGSWQGQVYTLFLNYGSNVNYGLETAWIHAYNHGDSCLDYGIHLCQNSTAQAMTTGIWLDIASGATVTTGIHLDNGGTLTTGIDIGDATTGIYLSGDYTNALKIGSSGTKTVVAATGTCMSVFVTSADSGASDGLLAYFDLTLTGNTAGGSRNVGIWTNLDSTLTALDLDHYVLDLGLYDGSTDGLTGRAFLLNMDFQIAAGSSPATTAFFRLNTNQDGTDPTYLFYFNNDESACLVKSDPGTTFYGYIKCFSGTGSVQLAIPVVNVT